MLKRSIFKFLRVILVTTVITTFGYGLYNDNFNIKAEESLEEQLKRLQRELEEIQKQKKELEKQINQELYYQSNLLSQIKQYDSFIKQTELVIKEKTKQIELYTAQVDLLNQEIEKTEWQIQELTKEINVKEDELKNIMFYIYKNSQINTIDLILSGGSVEDTLYWNHYLGIAKDKGLDLIAKLNNLKKDQEKHKTDATNQKNQLSTLLETLTAEKQALQEQINGLSWQKNEREKLMAQSKAKEEELKSQQEELTRKIAAYEAQIDIIMWEYLSRHPSGTYITKGTPIAQIGRTGFVLSYGPNGWYYPHPEKEPYNGAHLHFSLRINGQTVNPLNYIGYNGFGHPVPGAIITQGYHAGHKAIDFTYGTPQTTWGKPIYAPASGTVVYSTDKFDCDEPYWGLYTPPCSPGGPFPRHDLHYACIIHDGNFNGWVSCYAHIR